VRQPDRAAAEALMRQLDRPAGSFPPDFAAAIAEGRVGPELLRRYLELEQQFLVGALMSLSGGLVWAGWGVDRRALPEDRTAARGLRGSPAQPSV
jgi:hypothetical protein